MTLSESIIHLRDEVMNENFEYEQEYWLINCGYCETFAERLKNEFPYLEIHSTEELGILDGPYSIIDEYQPTIYGTIDFERLRKDTFWGDKLGHTFDCVAQYINTTECIGSHTFVFDGERFYDAEAPYGVSCVLDLPFFERQLGCYSTTAYEFYKQFTRQPDLLLQNWTFTIEYSNSLFIEVGDTISNRRYCFKRDKYLLYIADYARRNYSY